jgi:hypothetical protein
MREMLQEVITLQRQWTSKNTPEMQRRGELIRNVLPLNVASLSSTR